MFTAYVVDEHGEATIVRNANSKVVQFQTLGEGLDFVTRMRVQCAEHGRPCPFIAIVPPMPGY